VRTIDQDLLAQEAIQGKLDGDAQVAQAIEHAKRQVLAQAYIERTVSSASPASPQEISRFYAQNPALFEQRHLYRVVELGVVVAPDQLGALQDAVAGAKNLDAVVRWLESRKLPFELAIQNRASEQIPMNVLHRLVEMRVGQIAIFPTPGGASVVRLEHAEQSPLSEKQARPAIARYLLNRKRLELAQAEVTKLRERAKTDSGGTEAVRPETVTQTAARAQAQVAGPGIAFNTIDLVKVR
jgi:EpsD family peptidyl-prolyl cis-trans isomerase